MDKGVYVLILTLDADRWMTIGHLGRVQFRKGFYAYVGSAFGPGGLSARLRHHLKVKTKPHWHIDLFGQHAHIVDIWYAERRRHEHQWARAALAMSPAASPVVGFGCSDCKCRSHLIYFPHAPRLGQFVRRLRHHAGESNRVKSLAPERLKKTENLQPAPTAKSGKNSANRTRATSVAKNGTPFPGV
jgi:Uri superfamily endonuclease